MFLSIIGYIILSAIIIVMIHQLYSLLKNNFTSPKVIDLLDRPKREYTKIYENLHNNEPIKTKDTLEQFFNSLDTNESSQNTEIYSEIQNKDPDLQYIKQTQQEHVEPPFPFAAFDTQQNNSIPESHSSHEYEEYQSI